MANDFKGSKAQTDISFSVIETILTQVGSNYWTPMIFQGSATASANIVTPPSTGSYIEVTAANCSSLLLGTLLAHLTAFFAICPTVKVLVVVYDSVEAAYGGLTTAFNSHHNLGYFKYIQETGTDNAAQVALATLCKGDTLLSQYWVGTADINAIAADPSDGIVYDMGAAGVDGIVIYSAQSGINPALCQLALTLSYLDPATGVCVGNRYGNISTSDLKASGTTGGTNNSNLTSTQMTNARDNNVGFYQTVGNGSGQVALTGELTLNGSDGAAAWVEGYINYLGQVKSAEYLNRVGTPVFKNNAGYQGILGILRSIIDPFESQGRLMDVLITKTSFRKLPATAGNTIVIPNAWSATWARGLSFVTVQGSLTITL